MIQYPEIARQCSLAENIEDVFYVRWQLLNSCNYSCPGCSSSGEGNDSVIVRDRILAMAYRIMTVRRPAFFITLIGGEPTLHPFLPDIVCYFLTCGRNARVTVETNGSRELSYYIKLIKNLPPGNLCLKIFVHPQFADARHILTLAASIVESGQHIALDVVADPLEMEKTANITNFLIKYRQHAPFDLQISVKNGNAQPQLERWRNTALEEFRNSVLNSTSLKSTWPQAAFATNFNRVQHNLDPTNEFSHFYCCTGSNLVYIAPNGYFYGGTCNQASGNRPLWDAPENAVSSLAAIVQCRNKKCPGGINEVLPKFTTRGDAESWLQAQSAKQIQLNWSLGPVNNPLNPEPSLEAIIRSRLKNLVPLSADNFTPKSDSENLPPQIAADFADICKIYSHLASERSREIFLHELKALELADPAWLALPDKGRMCHETWYALSICLQDGINHDDIDKTILQCAFNGESPFQCALGKLPELLKNKYFSHLELDVKSLDLVVLKKIGASIYDYLPNLCIALGSCEGFIQIPLWLEENFPAYKIRLERREDCTFLNAHIAGKLPALAGSSVKISVIACCRNDSANLQRLFESLLLYANVSLEIIVLDDASVDESREIIDKYTVEYPQTIRSINFPEPRGLWHCLNTGLKAASGEYVTFIPASGLPAQALLAPEVDSTNPADIYALEIVENQQEAYVWELPAGEYYGSSALEAYLLHQFGPYLPFGRLYSRQLLDRFNIQFAEDNRFAGLLFDMRAFYAADKVRSISAPGYYSHLDNSLEKTDFADLTRTLDGIAEFRKWHPDSADTVVWQQALVCLYTQNRSEFFESVTKLDGVGRLHELLDRKRLLSIGTAREILLALMEDCIGLRSSGTITCHVNRQAPDWQKGADTAPPAVAYTAYGNAEDPLFKNPALTVVIPNYNKAAYLPACLDSVLSQSMADFELIIIDDHSIDGGYEILQAYADQHARIRLYRMEHNCLQGVCRNLGIDKARGKYLIFVDSDDLCLSGYFEAAIRLISHNNLDVAFFSSQRVDCNGNVESINSLTDSVLPQKSIMEEFYLGDLEFAPWAKIYTTEFLRNHNCRFPEFVYQPDLQFFISILSHASKIALSSQIAYQKVITSNSASNPDAITYRHLYSACVLYWQLNNYAEEYFGRALFDGNNYTTAIMARYDMDMFLNMCAIFLKETGNIPLPCNDYHLLGNNPMFIWNLIQKLGTSPQIGRLQDSTLAPAGNWHKFIPAKNKDPLVSILMLPGEDEDEFAMRLDSLLAQSLRNIEVLIMLEPRSMIRSLERYARSDGRITCKDIESASGLAENIESCLEQANGRYVLLSSPHEQYSPDFLLEACGLFERDPVLTHVRCEHGQCDYASGCKGTRAAALNASQLLKIYNSNKITNEISGYSIFSKKYISELLARINNKEINTDILMLHLYAESTNNQVIIDTGIHYYESSYVAEAHKDIDELIIEFEYLAAYLENNSMFKASAQFILAERAKDILEKANSNTVYDLIDDEPNTPSLPDNIINSNYLKKYISPADTYLAVQDGYLVRHWTYGIEPQNPEQSIIVYIQEGDTFELKNINKIITDLEEVEIVIIDDTDPQEDSKLYDMVENLIAIYPHKNIYAALYATHWKLGRKQACQLGVQEAHGKKIYTLDPSGILAGCDI